MVWLHRWPIPVGRRGVISSFKWFLHALLHVEEGGRGSAACAFHSAIYLPLHIFIGFLGGGVCHQAAEPHQHDRYAKLLPQPLRLYRQSLALTYSALFFMPSWRIFDLIIILLSL
jgi:hypothetical protein